jgi:hypothetical protein
MMTKLINLFKLIVLFVLCSIVLFTIYLNNIHFFEQREKLIIDQFLFCLILTKKGDLDLKATIAYESWIHKCDNYRFLTILPDQSPNDVEYDYFYDLNTAYILNNSSKLNLIEYRQKFKYIKLLQPPGLVNDSYRKLTDKVYLAYKYIYKKYPNYQWYLKCDDDTFFYYENLERFLIDKNYSRAVSYGRFVGDDDYRNSLDENQSGFLSGGAGYVLSNEAFGRLAKRLELNYSYCPNSGLEDCDVSSCLRKLGSVIGVSFDDQAKCRFHSNHLFTVYPSQKVMHFKLLFIYLLI